MKHIIFAFILILSWSTNIFALGNQAIWFEQEKTNAPPPVTGFCDCSGDVKFCWEVTSNDTDITNSGGCADSGWDTTATANSSVEIVDVTSLGESGYAIHAPTANDFFSFALQGGLNDTWTIKFRYRIDTWANNARLFQIYGGAGADEIRIILTGNSELQSYYLGNSSSVTATTSGALILEDTWHDAVCKFRPGTLDPSVFVNTNGTTSTNNTDLNAWIIDSNELRIGSFGGGAALYIRRIEIKNIWE